MIRFAALLLDFWKLLSKKPLAVRVWAGGVISSLIVLPVLELLTYQQIIELVSYSYSAGELSNLRFALLGLLVLIVFLLEVANYFSGLKRVRLVNYLVTLQRRAIGILSKNDGWSRAVASETIVGFLLISRLLVLGLFTVFLIHELGLIVITGIFVSLCLLSRQFSIELNRQAVLSIIASKGGKAISAHRLTSRIESSEKGALVSAFSLYVAAVLTIGLALLNNYPVETVLLLVLVFRFLVSGIRNISGSMMRLSRALVGAGYEVSYEPNTLPQLKSKVQITRWSRLNKYERMQDELGALNAKVEKLRASRDKWRYRAKNAGPINEVDQ